MMSELSVPLESGRTIYQYEYEVLITSERASVTVNLHRSEAIKLIWLHRPEFAGMPPEEVPEMDGEEFTDTLKEAVYAWVSTFPTIKDSYRER